MGLFLYIIYLTIFISNIVRAFRNTYKTNKIDILNFSNILIVLFSMMFMFEFSIEKR